MKMSNYLPMLLLLALAPAASAQTPARESAPENKLVQKVYSVADLVIPIDSANQPGCAVPKGAVAEPQNPADHAKQLMKMLNMVKPESWEACGGCGKIDYYPIGHALVVRQTPEVQQQVAEMLASLRKQQDVNVLIELRIVSLSPGMEMPEGLSLQAEPNGSACKRQDDKETCSPAQSKSIVWNDKQLRQFLQAAQADRRTNIMQAPKLTVLNGQTAKLDISETKHFLTGVKIEDCKGQMIFSPENKPHFIGTRCEVQAVVQENGKAVGLRFKLNMAEEYGPAELVPISTKITPVFENGVKGKPEPFTQYLQSPRIQTIDVARNATVPANGTLVLPAGTFTKEVPIFPNQTFMGIDCSKLPTHKVTETVVVLVTPRIVVVEEEPFAQQNGVGEFERWITQRQQVCPDPRARFAEAVTLPCPIQMPVREAKSGSCMTGVGCTSSSGMTGSICEPVCTTTLVARYYPGGFDNLRGMAFRGAGQEMSSFNTCGNIPWLNSVEYQCPVMANDKCFFVSFLDAGTVAAPSQPSVACAPGWSCPQADCERLQYILKRAVPKAKIEVISSGHGVVLTGTVARAEDIDTVMRIAGGVLGKQAADTVINAMSVGEQQVQLDVTVARVDRSKLAPRLGSGAKATSGSIVGGLVAPNGDAGKVVHGIVPAKAQDLLYALRTAGIAKLLAEPKLVTQSGRPARFLSGGQQVTVGAASGVVHQDIGTEIEFLPIVYGNGKIYLEVAARVRGVNPGLGITTCTGIVPGFDEQSVRTSVVLESGQTFAIGGLFQTDVQSSASKIPTLGDLPFISSSFQVVKQTESEQELVILVTPRLVEPMGGLVGNEGASNCPPCCKEQVAMCPLVKPAACFHEKSPAMNLADVVALSSSGVSDEIILTQMQTTGTTFALCTEEILFLKKNGVSDKVVMHMLQTRPKQPMPVYPPAAVQPVYTPAYSTQPSAPAQYFPPPLPPTPTPAYHPARSMGPVPLCVPYSCPLKLNGAYPPAMPSCPQMTAPSPKTVPYSYGNSLQFTPLRTIDLNGVERIGIDFGSPAPAAPKPVSLDFGFPFPLTDVRGTLIINERNFDSKRAKSKQAGEIGEEILDATAELIGGLAGFVGEEMPAFFSDAGENLNPKVAVTVGVGVKFGKNDSAKPK